MVENKIMGIVILITIIIGIFLFNQDDPMNKCQEKNSFDTCWQINNR